MKESLEGHFCGADDEHNIVYPKKKTLFELLKQENPALERPVKVDKNEKKHSSVCSYIDMINDVSQKLKIGFEQYKKAKEEEIRKLKKELAKEKSISIIFFRIICSWFRIWMRLRRKISSRL